MSKPIMYFNKLIFVLTFLLYCSGHIQKIHLAKNSNDLNTVISYINSNKRSKIRVEAVKVLVTFPEDKILPVLDNISKDRDHNIRVETAKVLGTFSSSESQKILTKMINDVTPIVVVTALKALTNNFNISDETFITKIDQLLFSEDLSIQLAAAEIMIKNDIDHGHTQVVSALDATFFLDRRKAIEVIRYYKRSSDLTLLIPFISSKDKVTKNIAMESIEYILGKPVDFTNLENVLIMSKQNSQDDFNYIVSNSIGQSNNKSTLLSTGGSVHSHLNKSYIAITNMTAINISNSDIIALTNRLQSEVVKLGKYIVLEREKMKEILKEQGFQLTGCTTSECMIEAGKLLSVEFIIGGSISKIGEIYSIELRVINIETGEIIASITEDIRGKIDMVLLVGLRNAAAKLSQL